VGGDSVKSRMAIADVENVDSLPFHKVAMAQVLETNVVVLFNKYLIFYRYHCRCLHINIYYMA